MSYEPTQPMTPPSTSLADQPSEDPSREGQDDPAQGDPAPAATVQVATPEGEPGQVTAPEGGLSQATIPRAALSRPSVPATPGNTATPGNAAVAEPQDAPAEVAAPRDDTAKAHPRQDPELTGDWASEYADAWGQGRASRSGRDQGSDPQADREQDNDPQGDWAQRYSPQGDWNRGGDPRGYGPQGYGPEGYGPREDWNRGNPPQGYGPQDYEPEDAPPVRPRRRRRPVRRSVISLFVLLVIAIVLVIGNFVGQAIAENDMANQFTTNGFPVKPSVDIEGFPFLTQVVQKDFKKVVISASNIPAGPVTISSLNATITGMHLNSSWNGATIDHLTATAFVSLSSLTGGISSELGDAASLTAVPDGVNKLRVTGTVLGLSASGVVEIKQTGPQQITVELPTSGGLVGTLLGSAASFPINLPAGVPPTLRITGLTLNGQGLTLSAAATDATFSK
jgi:hypothetical protein